MARKATVKSKKILKCSRALCVSNAPCVKISRFDRIYRMTGKKKKKMTDRYGETINEIKMKSCHSHKN
jgi:hypothetical protein